jgi:hypothetical protein
VAADVSRRLTLGKVAGMSGVQMGPGATALTRMFFSTSWLDSARVKAICRWHTYNAQVAANSTLVANRAVKWAKCSQTDKSNTMAGRYVASCRMWHLCCHVCAYRVGYYKPATC